MLNRLRPRITYANVISTLCLFILLGGGAYAATQLPANSVGTQQLKQGAVTSPKVKNGTLTRDDVAPGQFVRPSQLSGVNAAKLGGIGPGGFVHGAGQAISAQFRGGSRAMSPFVTIPGGLVLNLACDSSGFSFVWTRTGAGANRTFTDFAAVNGGSPLLLKLTPSSIFVESTPEQNPKQIDEDYNSDAGYATFVTRAVYDGTANVCIVTARGIRSP
jgi:hypothetical protein